MLEYENNDKLFLKNVKYNQVLKNFSEVQNAEKELEKEIEERRHEEILQSNRELIQAITQALADGKSISITIEGSNIHNSNFHTNGHLTGSVQPDHANKGINFDELILSLQKILEHLPSEEEKQEANDAFEELKDTLAVGKIPKKGLLNGFKSFVRRAIDNPIQTIEDANTLFQEGKKVIEILSTITESL